MKPQTIRMHPARGKSTDPIGVIEPPLTKRERFAMAAMQGLCANPRLAETPEDLLAEWAVRQADAAIEELNPTPKTIS